jgi:flagellar biosynthesis chaperone FliJ
VARNKASQAFTKLLAARQGRAVVEKFFEKQQRRHELERRRYEQHKLDEMSNHRQALTGLTAGKRESLWS